MKLKKILKDINFIKIKGMKDIEIRGVCSNSKYSSPGSLFIAKRGQKFDGTTFITQAINAGAIAIVTDIFDPFLKNITQIIVEDPNEVESQIAKNYYENGREFQKTI